MVQEQFVGTWKLVSARYVRPNGEIIEMYGEHSIGRIIYDADWNMAVQIMQRDRPQFVTGLRLSGSPEETQSAFRGYLAYFGTYSIDENKRLVTHHVEGAWHPNWVGLKLLRWYEFSGNRLILDTEPLTLRGSEAVGRLIWERAASASI